MGSDKNIDEIKTSPVMFKYTSHIRDVAKKQAVYGVQFNYFLGPAEPSIFASVGGNRVCVYECMTNGTIKLLQCYGDPDMKEDFYTICWTRTQLAESISSILVAAGKRGVIRVIDATSLICVHSFVGHTAAVNELKISPANTSLLLSASEDHSIRLWYITARVCVAVFGGPGGHRDQVISIDFNPNGKCFVSGSMDHSMRIWDLTQPEVERVIERAAINDQSFATHRVYEADFLTRNIHANYIDCVHWHGDLILSKSSSDPMAIVCWQPIRSLDATHRSHTDSATILHEFEAKMCDYWFMRFSLSFDRTMMALGTIDGRMFVWNLDNSDPKAIVPITLSHTRAKAVMRQPAFSRDGNVLICGADDGTILRWDRVE